VAGFVLDNSDETDALTDDAFYWIAPRRKIKRDNAAETHSPDKQIPAVRRGDREASSDNRRRRRLLIRFRKEADAEKKNQDYRHKSRSNHSAVRRAISAVKRMVHPNRLLSNRNYRGLSLIAGSIEQMRIEFH
jgi:hypothetical protein